MFYVPSYFAQECDGYSMDGAEYELLEPSNIPGCIAIDEEYLTFDTLDSAIDYVDNRFDYFDPDETDLMTNTVDTHFLVVPQRSHSSFGGDNRVYEHPDTTRFLNSGYCASILQFAMSRTSGETKEYYSSAFDNLSDTAKDEYKLRKAS